MSDKPRPGAGRPVVGSRPATPRPRKVAGAPRREPEAPAAAPEPAPGRLAPQAPAQPEPSGTGATGRLAGRTATALLAGALVLLLIALAMMGWYLWFRGSPEPTAQRPVVISEVQRAGAVAAARGHIVTILAKSHESYDEQTAAALDLIVPDSTFAEEYARTAEDVRDAFLEDEVELEYAVVGAGVVRAAPEKVQALLFLNQSTSKGGSEPTFTPYRALVTVVPSGSGWRVLAIDTK